MQWYTSGLNVDGSLAVTFRGDFDNCSNFNAADIDLLSAEVGKTNDNGFDLTGDGLVDQADRTHWVTQLAGSLFGDADLDKSVDMADFSALSENFSQSGGWAAGFVQFADFLLLSTNFGKSPTAATAVPEPNATILLLVGLVGLDRMRWIVSKNVWPR